MNLRIVPDTLFPDMYHMFDDKVRLCVIFQDSNGELELGFAARRLKMDELLEIHEFVTNHKERFTNNKE